MSTAVAYGSLTIVDVTDLGEFSVQPMSNLPLSIIYDPDQNVYTPNWASSNLQVTPAIYYAGNPLTLGSTGLTVTWQRQVGVSGATDLTTGETVIDGGILSVTANQFTSSSTLLTYIVTATYREPSSGTLLTAQGQITYSLVRNASAAKTASISGETVFKYDTSQTIVGASSIVLTAVVTGVSISEWQYKNGSDQWVTYPNSGTATTLTVNAADTTFVNDKCVVKLVTSDASTYDIHTITKLRDGAAGSATVSAVLTNDDQMIPYSSAGVGDFSSAVSRIIIYEGGCDVTSTWTIAQSYTNVTATASTTTKANDTVSVTDMDAATGNVLFTCTKSGYNSITKTFSVVKVQSGADGTTPTIYSVEADALALNKDIHDTFTPGNVTFTAYSQTGGDTKSPYSGRFRIFENITLAEYDAASPKPTPNYSSGADESSHTYTPSTSATSILCMLFKSGAFTTRVDSQLAVVTSDGQTGGTGATGPAGESAINVILGNYADVLTCTNDNKLMANQTVTIPFAAYEGTSKVPCTVTSVQLLGKTPTITNATASADGSISWALTSGTSVANASGTLSLTFTVTSSKGNKTVIESYSWSRNTAAKNGENAILLQIYTPNGSNIVSDTVTSVTLQSMLTDGSTDVTSSATAWQWAKFQNGSYNNISGATSSSYVVTGSTVESYASFRCTATYQNKPYYAYFSVFDKTDPIQVSVISTVGTQLVNGAGAGAVYAKVTRNGAEIDVIKSERFLTSNPTSATSGDYYYKIDTANKQVVLMKYTTSWAEASASEAAYTGTYSWSFRDKDGNTVTSVNGNALPTSGKIIYIDGDLVDGKLVADVQVTI